MFKTIESTTAQILLTVGCILVLPGCSRNNSGSATPNGAAENQLIAAIEAGKAAEVGQFLKKVDASSSLDSHQNSVLHILANQPFPDAQLAKLAIDEGANINATNDAGKTAWDIIWLDGPPNLDEYASEFLAVLLEEGFTPNLAMETELEEPELHSFVRRCGHARLAEAASSLYELEATDNNGWTALHLAAFEGNYPAAEGLLSAGAAPNAQTTNTVTENYVKGENTLVVKLLCEKGSQPLDFVHKGQTRLGGNLKELLESYGAKNNPNVNNRF